MSSFFKKQYWELLEKKLILIYLLNDFNFNKYEVNNFVKAFEFFEEFPDKFDGATVVRDFYILNGLDVCAMIHDYMYVKYNLPVNFLNKIKADYIYCKYLRKFNISWWSVWAVRFCGLVASSPIYAVYKKVKFNQTHTNQDSLEFINYIKDFK